jgi:hypothetical protein
MPKPITKNATITLKSNFAFVDLSLSSLSTASKNIHFLTEFINEKKKEFPSQVTQFTAL